MLARFPVVPTTKRTTTIRRAALPAARLAAVELRPRMPGRPSIARASVNTPPELKRTESLNAPAAQALTNKNTRHGQAMHRARSERVISTKYCTQLYEALRRYSQAELPLFTELQTQKRRVCTRRMNEMLQLSGVGDVAFGMHRSMRRQAVCARRSNRTST